TSISRSSATMEAIAVSWPKLEQRKVALVARRDLRDAVSELRLIIAMVGLTLAIAFGVGSGVRSIALFGGGTAVVNRLSLVGAFFVVFIPASFSLVLALESFVGERERTTLEVLLSTPLREAEIYAGKIAAVLCVSLTLCYGGLIVYCLITFAGLGYFPVDILLALGLSTIRQVAALVAGAVILRLLWMRRIPMLIAAAGFPIGALAGFLAGSTSAVPPSVVRPVLSSLVRAAGDGGALETALAIFAHNLLAFLLVAVLAILTLGLSGFLLTFVPGFLLGFAAALSSWTIALTGIVPNGLVEIPAAIIAGGLLIQVGATAMHMDERGGWSARVLAALADYIRALRWLVPALAVAAVLEVWLG